MGAPLVEELEDMVVMVEALIAVAVAVAVAVAPLGRMRCQTEGAVGHW